MSAPPVELNFASLMADIQRMFSTCFYRQLKAEGICLTRAQWRMIAIMKMKDGLTQSELADRLLMEKAPTGTLIDKLEDAGLVERRQDPTDRRVKRVFLTPATEPLLPMINDTALALTEESFRGISSEEQADLYRLLAQIRNNLKDLRAPLGDQPDSTPKEPPRG
ncbi:MarR family transcriptional regulator [Pseudomaricurvus alkylphenolicus]|uniref:MarR family winged helix-turn-helix transcriptional regulator n=1 Tax=Pseudomaricurvus alkylphenolicus TaxID=1306991 RepID=UPI00141EBE9B|nr:MarR family transcriptional regulator [Pseudomaricurvus alkylphenolicus]NIB41788.1 MarR family transcriptional regulator [Pseudomaricurvus alkylphenolicus]